MRGREEEEEESGRRRGDGEREMEGGREGGRDEGVKKGEGGGEGSHPYIRCTHKPGWAAGKIINNPESQHNPHMVAVLFHELMSWPSVDVRGCGGPLRDEEAASLSSDCVFCFLPIKERAPTSITNKCTQQRLNS
jgi:hypothetical protein